MFTSSDTMNSDPQKVSFSERTITTYIPIHCHWQQHLYRTDIYNQNPLSSDAVFTPMAHLSSTGQEWCTTLATAEVLVVAVESLVVQVMVCKRHIQPLVEIHVSNVGGNCQRVV